MDHDYEIIDISQPVSVQTACFPGDAPFSYQVTLNHKDSQGMNLCAFTMSPHVGTHADAPVHVRGNLSDGNAETVGSMALSPFIGPALVVDVSPCRQAITWAHVENLLASWSVLPQRVLFKTVQENRYDMFEPEYA